MRNTYVETPLRNPPATRPKPAFIEAAEVEAYGYSCGGIHVATANLGELEILIGREAANALVAACGGFHLPVPSPGQKLEITKVIIGLIGHEAANKLIRRYANTSVLIPPGRA